MELASPIFLLKMSYASNWGKDSPGKENRRHTKDYSITWWSALKHRYPFFNSLQIVAAGVTETDFCLFVYTVSFFFLYLLKNYSENLFLHPQLPQHSNGCNRKAQQPWTPPWVPGAPADSPTNHVTAPWDNELRSSHSAVLALLCSSAQCMESHSVLSSLVRSIQTFPAFSHSQELHRALAAWVWGWTLKKKLIVRKTADPSSIFSTEFIKYW